MGLSHLVIIWWFKWSIIVGLYFAFITWWHYTTLDNHQKETTGFSHKWERLFIKNSIFPPFLPTLATIGEITIVDNSSLSDDQEDHTLSKQPDSGKGSIASFTTVHFNLALVGDSTKLTATHKHDSLDKRDGITIGDRVYKLEDSTSQVSKTSTLLSEHLREFNKEVHRKRPEFENNRQGWRENYWPNIKHSTDTSFNEALRLISKGIPSMHLL